MRRSTRGANPKVTQGRGHTVWVDQPSTGDHPARSRGSERLLSFSDAVVAIAATLLVLPLVEIAPRATVPDIGQLLGDNRATLLAFILSFVVIYRFWLVHHRVFGSAEQVSGALVWLNGLWLLSIVFLPFPTQLIGAPGTTDNKGIWGLYIGTLLVASATLSASLWLIRRTWPPAVRDVPHPDIWVRGVPVGLGRILVMTLGLAVAFVLAVTVRGAGPWALLLLIPAGASQRLFGLLGPVANVLRRPGRR